MTTPPTAVEVRIGSYADYYPPPRAMQKRERRDLRRRLMKAVRENLSLGFRLNHTNAQEKAAARKITDQLLAGKNPGLVETLP